MKATKQKQGKRTKKRGCLAALLLIVLSLSIVAGCGMYVPDDSVRLTPVSVTEEDEEIVEAAAAVEDAAGKAALEEKNDTAEALQAEGSSNAESISAAEGQPQEKTEQKGSEQEAPGQNGSGTGNPEQEESAQEKQPQEAEGAKSSSGSAEAEGADGGEEAAAQRLVVCMGDSITFGTGLFHPGEQSYPTKLKGLLGEGWQVRNLGRPGYTLTESTLCYTDDPAYEKALASGADVFVIMLGTNDAYASFWNAEKYRAALQTMTAELRAACPEAKICLVTPPHCFLFEEEGMISDSVIGQQIVPILSETAEQEGLLLVDIYTPTEGRLDLFSDDKVHPNAAGAEFIAQCIYQSFSANISL